MSIFQDQRGKKLLDGITKITYDHDGSMGMVRNITHLICLCLPKCDISRVVIILVSFLNEDFN
jgi:hypothetical protein